MANSVTGRRRWAAWDSHIATINGLVLALTPNGNSPSTSEQTACIAPERPAFRHDPTICTSRSKVGTTTSTAPCGASLCPAAAPTKLFPDPVAIWTVTRSPSGADCPGRSVRPRTMAPNASSWWPRRVIPAARPGCTASTAMLPRIPRIRIPALAGTPDGALLIHHPIGQQSKGGPEFKPGGYPISNAERSPG